MKRKVLALVIPALLAAGAAHSAEIYNKDGNKLDLYGKVDGLHYFSDDASKDGDQSYVRFGFKGETQINDQLTGYGQWEYNVGRTTPKARTTNPRPVWRSQASSSLITVHSIMAVTTACCTT